jgi:hypothetical protein
MTSSDIKADVPPASGWRFKVGIGIFVSAFALLLVVPIAASLGAPGTVVGTMTGAVLVANKLLLMICIAVMGKPGYQRLKATVVGRAKRLAPKRTVAPVTPRERGGEVGGCQRVNQQADSDNSAV